MNNPIAKLLGPSWKTSTGGVVALLGAVMEALSDPQIFALVPVQYQKYAHALLGLGIAFGLLNARDNRVSSEQAGAATPSPSQSPAVVQPGASQPPPAPSAKP